MKTYILFTALLFATSLQSALAEQKLPLAMFRSSGVTTTEIKTGSLISKLVLPAEISFNGDSLVHIAPRFEGTITAILKRHGETVKRGDTLAVVQSNQSMSTYEIKTEVPGIIIEKDAALGEFVRNDKILFTIANPDKVWINAAVFPDQLMLIQEGMPARVSSSDTKLSGTGTVNYLRPTLSETTRTALARVVLDNSDNKWLPGMFVNVTIEIPANKNSLLIPYESAVFMDNHYIAFVLTKDGKHFEARNISVGNDNGELIEVTSGLKPGETVASGNTFIVKAEFGKHTAGE